MNWNNATFKECIDKLREYDTNPHFEYNNNKKDIVAIMQRLRDLFKDACTEKTQVTASPDTIVSNPTLSPKPARKTTESTTTASSDKTNSPVVSTISSNTKTTQPIPNPSPTQLGQSAAPTSSKPALNLDASTAATTAIDSEKNKQNFLQISDDLFDKINKKISLANLKLTTLHDLLPKFKNIIETISTIAKHAEQKAIDAVTNTKKHNDTLKTIWTKASSAATKKTANATSAATSENEKHTLLQINVFKEQLDKAVALATTSRDIIIEHNRIITDIYNQNKNKGNATTKDIQNTSDTIKNAIYAVILTLNCLKYAKAAETAEKEANLAEKEAILAEKKAILAETHKDYRKADANMQFANSELTDAKKQKKKIETDTYNSFQKIDNTPTWDILHDVLKNVVEKYKPTRSKWFNFGGSISPYHYKYLKYKSKYNELKNKYNYNLVDE